MYSFHSSPEEKNKLLYALTQHGIETTVDRTAKKKRIRDWIQESVIQEDDEEEERDEVKSSSNVPPRVHAGHVSSVRAEEKLARKKIVTTVKDASNKHINPRTGEIQHGPSEMFHQGVNNNSQASMVEYRRENGNDSDCVMRRTTKLVDVGSQTSNESQKQLEASVLNQTVGKSTSHGLISAFNSFATISVPESVPQTLLQPLQMSLCDQQQCGRTKSKQMYQTQRHNTTALTNQAISRSANNFNNSVNESGYGSLDKLRATSIDGNSILSSPVLSKRSAPHSSINSNPTNNERILINGLSHNGLSQTESSTPLHSDSGGENSPRGSTGFVNNTGIGNKSTVLFSPTLSMKDTAYDRIPYSRNKK